MNNKAIIAVMLTVVSLILAATHLWMYNSWLFFFGVESETIKLTVGIVLGLLSVSFVPTTFLVHWRENFITSNIYLLAAGWLGVMLYASIASVVVLLTLWLVDVGAYQKVIAIVALSAAFAYSGYGVWNAQFPRVKHITVDSKRMPDSWRGRTIVQLSDVHLGAIHHIRFMRRVVNMVNRIKPDGVFITGDMYDGVGKELGLLAQPLNDIKTPLGMYYVIGNHETYVGLDLVFDALKSTPVKILRDEMIDLDGVQLLGADYHLPNEKRDVPAVIKQHINPDKPSIILYHEPKPNIVQACIDVNADLALFGHTHKGQLWPFGFVTKLIYGQYHNGFTKTKNTTVYTSPGVGTWGPPMRTGNHPEIVAITFK